MMYLIYNCHGECTMSSFRFQLPVPLQPVSTSENYIPLQSTTEFLLMPHSSSRRPGPPNASQRRLPPPSSAKSSPSRHGARPSSTSRRPRSSKCRPRSSTRRTAHGAGQLRPTPPTSGLLRPTPPTGSSTHAMADGNPRGPDCFFKFFSGTLA